MTVAGEGEGGDASAEDSGPDMRSIMDLVIKLLVAAAVAGFLICAYMLLVKKKTKRRRR